MKRVHYATLGILAALMIFISCSGVEQKRSESESSQPIIVSGDMLKLVQAGLPPAPGTAGPGVVPEMGLITQFGCCGESSECRPGTREPQWGKFGNREVLQAESGEQLMLTCEDANIPFFALWHISATGERNRVGMCPFTAGCNNARFFYFENNQTENLGFPERFVSTRWISKDYGDNDDETFNPWTKVTDPDEDLLDWAVSDFNARTMNLNKSAYKWEYAIGPPVFNCPSDPPAEGPLASVTEIDPPVGPETEAFFDSVAQDLQSLSAVQPMTEDTRPPCDFNGDGGCDDADFDFFKEHKDTCKGDPNYHPVADIDGSGCIDAVDKYYLYDQDSDGDKVADIGDNCVATPNPDQADADGNRIGDACENAAGRVMGRDATLSPEQRREFGENINNRGFVSDN
jgi:hypothetical protein